MPKNWLGQEMGGGTQPFPWRTQGLNIQNTQGSGGAGSWDDVDAFGIPKQQFIGARPSTEQSPVSKMYGAQNNDIMQNFADDFQWGSNPLASWRQTPKYHQTMADYSNAMLGKGGGGPLSGVGGLSGAVNILGTGLELWQNQQQIGNLQKYRGDLTAARARSAALDEEKFGLVKQEYDTRNTKRKADMWAQRLDPASGGTANPYMSNLIQDA
tara:strand:+ start:264 stop:899 length:636 start_codon:yes stop_codon:yes gene_type:complete